MGRMFDSNGGQSMKRFAHDIQFTLLIKGILLLLLWVVCFKGAERNTMQASLWLFGVPTPQQQTSSTHTPLVTAPVPASILKHTNKATL